MKIKHTTIRTLKKEDFKDLVAALNYNLACINHPFRINCELLLKDKSVHYSDEFDGEVVTTKIEIIED